jgi:hypothetical protein
MAPTPPTEHKEMPLFVTDKSGEVIATHPCKDFSKTAINVTRQHLKEAYPEKDGFEVKTRLVHAECEHGKA